MIDFHAHCLPEMDDGAADTKEALVMLQDSVNQGVTAVVATPHFYAGEESVASFLERRGIAMDALQTALAGQPDLAGEIQLLMGAEVLAREGVSRLDLRPLCLQGSDVLLLELPFIAPPVWLYEEIENIVFGQGLRVMLAHIDRYMQWYSGDMMGYLTDTPGMMVQINGDSLLHRRTFRHLYRWLPSVECVVLGSDMHNADHRAQNLAAVSNRLRRSAKGREWLEMTQHSAQALRAQFEWSLTELEDEKRAP